MLQLLVLLPLAAVLLPQAMSAEESGEDVVEFVLHKRMIRDIDCLLYTSPSPRDTR
mgnify:CR=1 FL=1